MVLHRRTHHRAQACNITGAWIDVSVCVRASAGSERVMRVSCGADANVCVQFAGIV